MDVAFKNTLIKVYKNFRYEEPDLEQFSDYKELFRLVGNMRKLIKNSYKIKDSHDVVGFMMIIMNLVVILRGTLGRHIPSLMRGPDFTLEQAKPIVIQVD